MTATDERTTNLEEHREGLRASIAAGEPEEIMKRVAAASIAVEAREADEMIGLEPVSDALVTEVDDLIVAAIEAAAGKGHGPALVVQAKRLLDEGNEDAGVAKLRAAAASGDARSATEAAWVLWEDSIADHAEDANAFAELGAKTDPTGRAEYVLGLFAYNAFGRKESQEESRAFHEAAAKKGNADAMFELYAMLSQGLGGKKDAKGALAWCTRAAEGGNARAMSNLGSFYATGKGVSRDAKKSALWYDRAARAGNGKAAATLGVMYAMGNDVREDADKAKEYFALADEHGFDWREFAETMGLDPDDYELDYEDEDEAEDEEPVAAEGEGEEEDEDDDEA